MSIPITVSDFKTYFARDFSYGTNSDQVYDADITKAINEADIVLNRGLTNDKTLSTAFLYLTAHLLVVNFRESFNGVQSIGADIIQSNSQGVSESYAIPKRFINNAVINPYTKTGYGRRYLSYILPNMIANVGNG